MKFCSMDRNAYFRASKLNYEIEVNKQQIEEITSWLESERFEGVTMSFVNEQGTKLSRWKRIWQGMYSNIPVKRFSKY